MRRHELSLFSLLAGAVFSAGAIGLLVTDGRFSSYNVAWSLFGIVAAGMFGIVIIAVSLRRISAERRVDSDTGFGPDE